MEASGALGGTFVNKTYKAPLGLGTAFFLFFFFFFPESQFMVLAAFVGEIVKCKHMFAELKGCDFGVKIAGLGRTLSMQLAEVNKNCYKLRSWSMLVFRQLVFQAVFAWQDARMVSRRLAITQLAVVATGFLSDGLAAR